LKAIENVQNIKPHPEVYLKAARHFQLQPEECLIIEDSLIGVEAGKQAGIEVVAIYDRYSAHELDDIKAKADYFVQDYASGLFCAGLCGAAAAVLGFSFSNEKAYNTCVMPVSSEADWLF